MYFSFLSLVALLFSAHVFSANKLAYMVESANEKQIAIADEDGSNPVTLTSGSQWHLYPALDPSGTQVAYVEGSDQDRLDLVVQNLETSEKEIWGEQAGRYLHPNFSGDGRWLAVSYRASDTAKAQIQLLNVRAGKINGPVKVENGVSYYKAPTLSIPSEGDAYFPMLSYDGSILVYQHSAGFAAKDVILYNRKTKKTQTLSEPRTIAMAPALSFDGRYVAFTQSKADQWAIYLLKLEDNSLQKITDTEYHDFAPAFTADGSILFASDRTGTFQLYKIDKAELVKKTFQAKPFVTLSSSLYAPSASGQRQRLLPPMIAPARSSFATALVGDRIYVAGGHQGPEHTYPENSFSDRVEYFDLCTHGWHPLAPLPKKIQGFRMAAHGKFLYAFGGFAFSATHKPGWKSVDTVYRYDIEADVWQELGTMPRPRSSYELAVLDDRAYLLGGWDSTPKSEEDYEGKFHAEIDVYDLKSETFEVSQLRLPKTLSQPNFSRLKKIPAPLRRAFSSVVLGNEIVLAGGLGEGSAHFDLLDQVTSFNPKTGKWHERTALPYPTFAPALSVRNGSLFIFGGMRFQNSSYDYLNSVYELAPGATQWKATDRYLSETKAFSNAISLDNQTILLFGGHSYEGGDAPVTTVEIF